MRTKIILIGRSMAGKTTLCQYLTNEELRYKKTQTIQVINKTMVDTQVNILNIGSGVLCQSQQLR